MNFGICRELEACWGIDLTAKGVPAFGWLLGPGTPNVVIEGRPVANMWDICLSSLGGTGFVVSRPRTIEIGGRTVAAEFDWIVGSYQGYILTGAATVRTTI